MDRKQAEMAFHDNRERDRQQMSEEEWLRKYSNKRWYAITEDSRAYVQDWLARHCPNAVVLDFGCGLGENTLRMAGLGAAEVHSIDISPESVETTQDKANAEGFGDRVRAIVMDAENMTYNDGMFDVIICSGVLHHMDVSLAFPELARVLKKTGSIIAIEALGYNPLISLYRKLTPHLRTDWEKDHILTDKELRIAKKSFDGLEVRYFHLASIGAALFQKTPLFKPLLALGRIVDFFLLRLPLIRLMAWQMVFVLSKPK